MVQRWGWCLACLYLCVQTLIAVPQEQGMIMTSLRVACSRFNYSLEVVSVDSVSVANSIHGEEDSIGAMLDRHESTTYVVFYSSQPINSHRVDAAVTTRPWWSLAFIGTDEQGEHLVVVQQVSAQARHMLELMAQRSYKPAEACERTPLLVSIHEDNTWGNRYYNIASEYFDENYIGLIFHIFIKTRTFGPPPVIYFASPREECLDIVNKWNCLFLSATNCTVPMQLENCADKTCMPDHWTHGIYTTASSSGVFVNETASSSFMAAYKKTTASTERGLKQSVSTPPFTALHSNALAASILTSTTGFKSRRFDDLQSSIYYNGFATRFNANFRAKLDAIVGQFRRSFNPVFTPSAQCIAVHVRMDDRTPKAGVDITQWCNKCAKFDPADTQQTIRKDFDDSKEGCRHLYSDWMDMGCLSPLPFGLATFDHFINASIVLNPDVENIFVLTDDFGWVRRQIALSGGSFTAATLASHSAGSEGGTAVHSPVVLRNKYKIHVFPVRPNHRQYTVQAAEDFWASLVLAQQCSGFVGHFGSTVTSMIFRTMCYYHDHRFLQCPPVYDISARAY
jgi:hypothetical protein